MSTSPFDFTGRHIFVAGGTSGINLGIAQGFAAAGASLFTISRRQEKVDAAVAALAGQGVPAAGMSADVRDFAQVQAAIAAAVERFGAIDVLVSGAAGNFLAPAAGLSSNGFRTVVDIDLNGTFNVMRAAYAHLARPEGARGGASVINISARQAWAAMPLQIHACAAKAGVDQITRVLALEWGLEGIRVNSIAPGPIEGTEGMERLAPTPEAARRVTESIPLGRWGTKGDIANMALFLASPLASYVTGCVISVDGGLAVAGGREFRDVLGSVAPRA